MSFDFKKAAQALAKDFRGNPLEEQWEMILRAAYAAGMRDVLAGSDISNHRDFLDAVNRANAIERG